MGAGALKAIRAAPTLVAAGIEKALAQDTNCNRSSTVRACRKYGN